MLPRNKIDVSNLSELRLKVNELFTKLLKGDSEVKDDELTKILKLSSKVKIDILGSDKSLFDASKPYKILCKCPNVKDPFEGDIHQIVRQYDDRFEAERDLKRILEQSGSYYKYNFNSLVLAKVEV